MPRQTPQAGAFGQRRSQAGNLSTYVAPTQVRDAGSQMAQVAKSFAGLSNTINQMGLEEGREADQQMRELAPKIAEMREAGLSDDQISEELTGLTTRRSKKRIRKSLDKDGTLNNLEDPQFNLRLAETQGIERGSNWLEEHQEFLTDAMETSFEQAGLDGMSEDERLKAILSDPELVAQTQEELEGLSPLARIEAEKQIEDGLRILAARGKEKAKVTRENVLANGESTFALNGVTILGEPGTDPSAVAASIAERISTNSVDLDNATGQKVVGQTVESIIADLDRQVERGDLSGAQAAFFIEELQGSLQKKGGGSVLDQYSQIGERLESAKFLLGEGADQGKRDEKKAQAISSTRTFVEISLMEDVKEQEAEYGIIENALRAAIDGTVGPEQAELLRAIDVDPSSLNDIRIAQATVESQRERDRGLDANQRRRGVENRKANEDSWMRDLTGKIARGEITRQQGVVMSEGAEMFAAADRLRNISDQKVKRNRELIAVANSGLPQNEDGLTALDVIRQNSPDIYAELLFTEDEDPMAIHKRIKVYSQLGQETIGLVNGDDGMAIELQAPVPGSGVAFYEEKGIPIKQALILDSDDALEADIAEIAKVGYTMEDNLVSVDPEANLIMAERALFSGRLKTTDLQGPEVTVSLDGQDVLVRPDLLPANGSMDWSELLQLRFTDITKDGVDPGWWTRMTNGGSTTAQQKRNLKSAFRRYSATPLSATQLDELVASYALQLSDD